MTFVFIHGAGCTDAAFREQRSAFPNGLFIRLPGRSTHGDTSSIGAFADAVDLQLQTDAIDDAVLVGSSMGGAIALELAVRGASRIRACVLLGSGAKMRVGPAMFAQMETDFPAAVESLIPIFFATPTDTLLQTMREQLFDVGQAQTIADFRACDAFDRTANLADISIPILAVTGSEDRLMPPKFAQMIAERVPGARAEILPGLGHLPMLEAPAQINALLQAFGAQITNKAET
ncbi:MAG: alpha/beta fold hydrolase [Vulcanimicrobiaceae bacterium]